MNTSILRRALLAILCLGTVAFAQDEKDEKKTDKVDPAAVRKEASYAIGVNIGRSIQRDQLDLDVESLAKGIRDALGDKKVELTDAEIRDAIGKLQDLSVAATKKKGADYLANNKKKKGVVVTKTGLQYEVIKKGTGPKPTKSDTVRTNYRGTLITGKEFDSSYKRGEPAEFPVGRVIPGWTEALQLMPVGSKWRLVIPSELAYGARGAGNSIGPHEVLVFEIELLGIIE